jgi:SAM-dependent methyltransferase
MGVKLNRQKPRQMWLSILYRMSKLPFGNAKTKQKIYLNLEWLFDRLAHENSFKIYSETDHPVRTCTKVFLLDRIKTTDKVLDLGCDKGVMSNYLADKAAKVVGIDFDSTAIETAKTKYKKDNLEFRSEEALAYLKNNKEQFDVLILSHILEHLDNPQQFIDSFKGFFKSIYIEVPDFDRNYLNQYRHDLKMKLIYADDDHVSEFDRTELTTLLKQCNVKVLETEFRYGVQKYWCSV